MRWQFHTGSEQTGILEAGTVPQLEESTLELGAGYPSFEDQFKMDTEEKPQKGVKGCRAGQPHLDTLLRQKSWTAAQATGLTAEAL